MRWGSLILTVLLACGGGGGSGGSIGPDAREPNDDVAMSVPLPSGTYSIRVFSPVGDTNRYDLAASAH